MRKIAFAIKVTSIVLDLTDLKENLVGEYDKSLIGFGDFFGALGKKIQVAENSRFKALQLLFKEINGSFWKMAKNHHKRVVKRECIRNSHSSFNFV